MKVTVTVEPDERTPDQKPWQATFQCLEADGEFFDCYARDRSLFDMSSFVLERRDGYRMEFRHFTDFKVKLGSHVIEPGVEPLEERWAQPHE